MAPTNDSTCSSVGNPLTTLSKLGSQDKSLHQDKNAKISGLSETFRSQPQISNAQSQEVFDTFLGAHDADPSFELAQDIAELHIGGAAECNETYYSSEQTQKHGGEVIEDDTGSRELHNLETAWNAAHMKANSNNVAVPVPKYGEISTPSEKPYHYFLKGGIVSKQSDLSLPKWLKSTNYGTNSYDGETVTTGKYTDKLEQSVICMPSQSTDYSKGHEAYAEFDVATSNCLYNMRIPLVSRDDASDSRPTQYDRIKSVLVENSGELRGLFEKYPNIKSLCIEDTLGPVVLGMVEFMVHGGQYDAAEDRGWNDPFQFWEYHLLLLEAAFRYDVPTLKEVCIKILTTNDIFPGSNITDIYAPTGRTLISEFLHRLYSSFDSCKPSEVSGRFGWIKTLREIILTQLPRLSQPLLGGDAASRLLRADIRELYGESSSFAYHHMIVLKDEMETYEEVTRDQDGIWKVQLKPDALKLPSKL